MRFAVAVPPRTAPFYFVLVLAAGLTGGAGRPSAAPAAAPVLDRPGPTVLHELRDPHFAAAAVALRGRDCEGAVRELAPLAAGNDVEKARFARVVSGLQAYSCGSSTRALELLGTGGVASDPLEDWRLYALAETAHQLGQVALSHDSFAHLLADYRSSPLWSRALVAAALHAHEDGDAAGALELVRWSREQPGLSGEAIGTLEGLAWKLGAERAERSSAELANTAARRLLIHAPVVADELDVIERFRPANGKISWVSILSSQDLLARARSLMAAGLPGPATIAYEAVGAADRDLEWRLESARALTADRRPSEALARLLSASAKNAEERSRVLLEQAQAETALATLPAGRKRAAVAERARRATVARGRWLELARLEGGAAEPRIFALRRVAQGFDDESNLPAALGILRTLRGLAPEDASGAPYLWNVGWKQFAGGRYAQAIATWTQLAELYPESRETRAGQYWTARSHERMGRREQAVEIFERLAATDTTDFYRRHALVRLGPAARSRATAEPVEIEPWPAEPLLDRAHLFTDLGMDQLALDEANLHGDKLDPRAKNALVGVVLSHQGRRREGIPYLRRAFPALGGARQAGVPEEARRLYYPLAFSSEVRALAREAGVEPTLVYGIIRQESAFDLTALSHAGARGLMQLMPGTGRETAKRLGLPFTLARLEEPAFNLTLGTTYFSDVLDMFGGREELALAGYNGGPYRILRLWRQAGPSAEVDSFLEGLSIEESRTYVKRVLLFADSYRQLYGEILDASSGVPAAP